MDLLGPEISSIVLSKFSFAFRDSLLLCYSSHWGLFFTVGVNLVSVVSFLFPAICKRLATSSLEAYKERRAISQKRLL